jgi:hypothetical protein
MHAPDEPQGPKTPGMHPGSAPAGPERRRPEFYDTQFIVNRMQSVQRRARLRVMGIAAGLALAAGLAFALSARRAEAPAHLKAPETTVPVAAPHGPQPQAPPKPAPAVPPAH